MWDAYPRASMDDFSGGSIEMLMRVMGSFQPSDRALLRDAGIKAVPADHGTAVRAAADRVDTVMALHIELEDAAVDLGAGGGDGNREARRRGGAVIEIDMDAE